MDVAEKLRKTHKQEHPDYKYQPRRKKGRSLTASAVQCGDGFNAAVTAAAMMTLTNSNNSGIVDKGGKHQNGIEVKTNNGHNRKMATTATNSQLSTKLNGKTTNIKLNKQVRESTTTKQINGKTMYNTMMDFNETVKNTLKTAGSLTQTQSMSNGMIMGDETADFMFNRYDYTKRLDSPCSTTSSLQSCGTGGNENQQPLTPPATPYLRSLSQQQQHQHYLQRTMMVPPTNETSGLSEYNLLNIEGREFISLDDCSFNNSHAGGSMNINGELTENQNQLPPYALQFYPHRSTYDQQNSLEYQNYNNNNLGGSGFTEYSTYRRTDCTSSPTIHSIEPLNYFNISSPLTKSSKSTAATTTTTTMNTSNYVAPYANATQNTIPSNEDVEVNIEQYFIDHLMPIEPNTDVQHTTSTMTNSSSLALAASCRSPQLISQPAPLTAETSALLVANSNSAKSSLYAKIPQEPTHMLHATRNTATTTTAVATTISTTLSCLPTPSNSSTSCSSSTTPSSLPSPQKLPISPTLKTCDSVSLNAHVNVADNLNCFYVSQEHTTNSSISLTSTTAATLSSPTPSTLMENIQLKTQLHEPTTLEYNLYNHDDNDHHRLQHSSNHHSFSTQHSIMSPQLQEQHQQQHPQHLLWNGYNVQ
ncbi:sox100B isoform 2-T3 [Cochliomyia hominivorax]